ncbi:transposase-like protein [Sphingomonas zeicaulis]
MSKMGNRFSPEVRERAVRMVGEHRAYYGSEWKAMTSIASKIGCAAEMPRRWRRTEAGRRATPAAQAVDEKARLKLLEREVKELRRANEIMRKASGKFRKRDAPPENFPRNIAIAAHPSFCGHDQVRANYKNISKWLDRFFCL